MSDAHHPQNKLCAFRANEALLTDAAQLARMRSISFAELLRHALRRELREAA